MEFDGGLQRAIFASLQAQFEYARVAASSNYPRMVSTRPPPQQQQQPRAAIMPQQSTQRLQPQRRDITPTAPAVQNRGKRATLAREGILPTPSRNGGATTSNTQQRRNTTSRQVVPIAQQRDEVPVWMDECSGDEQSQQPSRKTTDQVIGWEEILSGGRVQRQSRDGTHLLLVTEEPYNGVVNALLRCDVVAIRGEGPLFPTDAGTQDVAPNGVASVSAQVQNLGGRGRYVCCVVGVVVAPGDETSRGILGATVHYDPSGSVFVSADVWRVEQTTDGVEKVAVLQAPVPVRMQRDRVLVQLRVRSSWPHHVMDVLVNHEPIFTNVSMAFGMGGDSSSDTGAAPAEVPLRRMRPVLMVSGGRVSLKGILCGDPPPAPPTPMEPSSSPGGRPSTNAGIANVTNPSSRRIAQSNKPLATPSSNSKGGRATTSESLPQPPLALPPGVDPDLAARIEAEVLDRSPNVNWDDVAGMGEAKQLLNEAVVLPLIVPELFTGVLQPWKGVLLFGPPGTGKTMLAKAVATSAKTTFFNISASVIINKHFGESEKMVRALFEVARLRSPSTIFLDEVDALMGTRGGSSEHEAMRRVKTELLRQMDGLHGGGPNNNTPPRVMVLATTNRPWDLDEAMRRRLEKRIYVPLPDLSGRLDLLRQQCREMRLDASLHLEPIARRTEGFSGADLNLLCRNACMMPMRRLVDGKSPDQLAAMKAKGEMVMGHVMEDDFNAALEKMSASVNRESIVEFEAWSKEFGSL